MYHFKRSFQYDARPLFKISLDESVPTHIGAIDATSQAP